MADRPVLSLRAASFLEYAFLRWVLAPATTDAVVALVEPQAKIAVDGHTYRVDYEIRGAGKRFVVELDGFEHHGTREAFTYDRLRQNDLTAAGRIVVRFSYAAIRLETGRCVAQLQSLLRQDPLTAKVLEPNPRVERPEMDPDPLFGLAEPPTRTRWMETFFDRARSSLKLATLRACQSEAFAALGNFFHQGGTRAACVMSVGAGKTALGVAASLAFTRKRAMIVTPGSVILGTFDRALDPSSPRNVLYTLPNGPLIPGCKPPRVVTLARNEGATGAVKSVGRDALLQADIIVARRKIELPKPVQLREWAGVENRVRPHGWGGARVVLARTGAAGAVATSNGSG